MIPGSVVFSSRDPVWVYTRCLILVRDCIQQTKKQNQTGNVFHRMPTPAGGNPASHQDGCTCTQPQNSSSYHHMETAHNYLFIHLKFSFP